jgi:hypothetical protein
MNRVVFYIVSAVAVIGGQASVFAQQPMTASKIRAKYQEFQREVEKVVSTAREVSKNDLERGDIRTLQFLLQDLKKHVNSEDWKQASETKNRMQIAFQRSQKVAADAPRRKLQWEREAQERRHRELVRQQERQHRELLNAMRK